MPDVPRETQERLLDTLGNGLYESNIDAIHSLQYKIVLDGQI